MDIRPYKIESAEGTANGSKQGLNPWGVCKSRGVRFFYPPLIQKQWCDMIVRLEDPLDKYFCFINLDNITVIKPLIYGERYNKERFVVPDHRYLDENYRNGAPNTVIMFGPKHVIFSSLVYSELISQLYGVEDEGEE